jgi:hypothetical protein
MSSHDEIRAAIKAHRRDVAEHDYGRAATADGVPPHSYAPRCLDGAIAFFSYRDLGNELEPGLAEMAAVCASNAKVAQARKVRDRIDGGRRPLIRLPCPAWNGCAGRQP